MKSPLYKNRILFVELEPAPYKYDLFNQFVRDATNEIFVLFSIRRNYAPDSGHNYEEFPKALFTFVINNSSALKCLILLFKLLLSFRPHFVVVSGYSQPATIITIIICILLKRKYFVRSDKMNNSLLSGFLAFPRNIYRKVARWIIFRSSLGILTCGVQGKDSALAAGCPHHLIYDFPYVVDKNRILSDQPRYLPNICREDVNSGNTILLFSGRLIPRKGLLSLLSALHHIRNLDNWVLWVEGDGPLIDLIIHESNDLEIFDRCRFLGFCQMSTHSWLLSNCNILVVPSLKDPWGIVVDEGMQLGKPVIGSDATGSANDRIEHNHNGMLFRAGNIIELMICLQKLLSDNHLADHLGHNALITASHYSPQRNVDTITNIIKSLRPS